MPSQTARHVKQYKVPELIHQFEKIEVKALYLFIGRS